MSSTAGSSTEDGRKQNGRTELGVEYVENSDLLKNWNILLTVSNPLVKNNIRTAEADNNNTGNNDILDVTEAFTEDLEPIAVGDCMIVKAPVITDKVKQYRKSKKSVQKQSKAQEQEQEQDETRQ